MTNKEYAEMVGENLRRITYEKGIPQARIAQDLHLSKATVSSWFTGKRAPRVDKLDALCRYLMVDRTDVTEPYKGKSTAEPVQTDPAPAPIISNKEYEGIMKITLEIFNNDSLRRLFAVAIDSEPEALAVATNMLAAFNTRKSKA